MAISTCFMIKFRLTTERMEHVMFRRVDILAHVVMCPQKSTQREDWNYVQHNYDNTWAMCARNVKTARVKRNTAGIAALSPGAAAVIYDTPLC